MKESDIRPPDLFNQYLELVRRDVKAFFGDSADLQDVPCPACLGTAQSRNFKKDDFNYRECADCRSLYLSPRPGAEAMTQFYAKAESVQFWGDEFYRRTAQARREKLFRPRAQKIVQIAEEHGLPMKARFSDIGPGTGLLLDEVAALGRFACIGGVEPAPNLAALCREKGYAIQETTVENLPEDSMKADMITGFEVLEHVQCPKMFLSGLRRLAEPESLILLTTLTADGFDIQTLWQDSKAVHPPHHINLLSKEGFRHLFDRAGLEITELTTPGQLDVDIVRNTLREKPEIEVGTFIRRLATEDDMAARAGFQKFLSDNLLSSHIRIIAKIKGSN